MKKDIKPLSLIMSIIALVITSIVLIGTTFAWFTDSVTSSGNKIKAGNLKVDLQLYDDVSGWYSLKNNSDPIFDYENWEPGYTDVKLLKIENKGSLALKWKAKFVSQSELSILADVIDVYVKPSAEELTYPTDRDLVGYTKVGTIADFVNTIEETTNGILLAGEYSYLGIALKMQNVGNEYQGLSIGGTFDIQILATQVSNESDGFNDGYDLDAEYPTIDTGRHTSNSAPLTLRVGSVSVTIPTEAEQGNYQLEVSNEVVLDDSTALNIELLRNGEEASGSDYTVEIELGGLKEIVSVKHENTFITEYTYSAGVLSFETQSFSPFVITYKDIVAENVKFDDENGTQLISGDFEDYNPVSLDPTLAEENSEYFAIKYAKTHIEDGVEVVKEHYVVAERATTVVVSASETPSVYAENNEQNYEVVSNQSGKLYSVFSSLQNQEFSTVYLLPGTYVEGTVIYVYSSMDIVGLGDKEDIVLVKTEGFSKSNRHMFNVSGTKADYIHVTISNMTIDVTSKGSASGFMDKDSGAVQSIRKSKVKCYDLNVIKASDGLYAFYVNGNNAVDGVKHTAYLYAENCTVQGKTSQVLTTNGTYKFYHTNIVCTNGNYTQNSGSILNKTLERDNWNW